MLKAAQYFSILFSAFFIFTTCKKYPENNLVFKRPIKVLERWAIKPWILEYYLVNDIDSTNADFLKVFKEQGVVIGEKTYAAKLYTEGIIQGGYEFKSKKKAIQFFYSQDNFHSNSTTNSNYINQRNIFLDDELHWQIETLCKDQFWIIASFNNSKYEIHFK